MSSQLVVLDLSKSNESINFSELTREHTDTIVGYLRKEYETELIHQYTYNLENGNYDKLQILVLWKNYPMVPREQGYQPTPIEKLVTRLCKLYEREIDGYIFSVKHNGYQTMIEFKSVSHKQPPLNTDWLTEEITQ